MNKTISKILIYIFLAVWTIVFIGIGVKALIGTPDQINRDKAFIKKRITPQIATIDSFKLIHKRLPTVTEYGKLRPIGAGNSDTEYFRDEKGVDNEIKNYFKKINWSNNYVLAVWRGDWFEYYISSIKNMLQITQPCPMG